MKVVIQRVIKSSVSINNKEVAKIGNGFLILLGISKDDNFEKADYIIKKIYNLRVFSDENDKMNLSIQDINGELLIVSQFTLYADCKKGNRPSFINAAKPELANELYEYFIEQCKKQDIKKVATGKFGADMQVNIQNDGPVTIILEK